MRLFARRWAVVLVNVRTGAAHPTPLARTWRRSTAEHAARVAAVQWTRVHDLAVRIEQVR